MPYRIAGIDVHKRMLVVVICDVEVADEFEFERRQFGSNPAQLQALAAWLVGQQVEEVVMESTAPYWKPVWGALERYWRPLCQKREGAPLAPRRGACTWRSRNRIVPGEGARTTFRTPSGW